MKVLRGEYRHYKGGLYEVIGEALHSETKEELVVYVSRGESSDSMWVRPKEMFLEEVELEGRKVPRFERV